MQQTLELPGEALTPPRHPVVGTQKDIRYYASTAALWDGETGTARLPG
jgi:hypothetical protein